MYIKSTILSLQTRHRLHSLHGAQLLQQCVELRRVVNQHVQIAAEQSIVTVDVYRLHHYLLLLRDDACDVVHDAEVVVSYNAQRDVILRLTKTSSPTWHGTPRQPMWKWTQ